MIEVQSSDMSEICNMLQKRFGIAHDYLMLSKSYRFFPNMCIKTLMRR